MQVGMQEVPAFTRANGPANYAIVDCRQCGLGHTEPALPPDQLKEHYAAFGPHRGSLSDKAIRRMEAVGAGGWRQGMLRALYRWRKAKFAPFMGRRGKTIDLGCGSGDFSVRMAKLGWDSSAHDVYESGGSEARRHNIPVYCCQIEDLPSAAGTDFDLVTSWHALEHEHNPARILRVAYKLLRPGGELVIAVPNYGSLERKLIGNKWDALQAPIHLLHFTKRSMHCLLVDHGFESIQCDAQGSYYHRSSKLPRPIAKAASKIISAAQGWLGFGAELRISARKARANGA